MTIDQFYGLNPWSGLDRNQRPWYVPALMEVWRERNVFAAYAPMKVDLMAQRTQRITFNIIHDFEPKIGVLDDRALWAPSMRTDSSQVSITTERHGGKTSINQFDDMITYWQDQGRAGLLPLIQRLLGQSMVDVFDLLARNAFLQGTYKSTLMDSFKNWATLTKADTFNFDWALDCQLKAMSRSYPGFDGRMGSILCITTPGSIYAINKDPKWIALHQYNEAGMNQLVNGEVGAINGVRFVMTPKLILYNCGAITKQVGITAPVAEGQGGHNWSVYTVGQAAANPVLITEPFVPEVDIKVGDIVTVHIQRTNAYGVVGGVDPYHEMTFQREVKYVDPLGMAIGFDRPMNWAMTTDLGGGIFGYITKGIHVNSSIFMYAPGGIVAGVSKPPEAHRPPTIDDFMSQERFSWDTWTKYQEFRPELFEVVFHAGAIRTMTEVAYGD